MNQVIDHLYIGDISSRTKADEYKIKGIVSVCSVESLPARDIEQLVIRIDDIPSADIMRYFHLAYNFIDRLIRDEKNVLVHCHAGISRSATIVCSYLMLKNKWDYETAIKLLRSKRPQVNPNVGFVFQLKQIEPHNKERQICYPHECNSE